MIQKHNGQLYKFGEPLPKGVSIQKRIGVCILQADGTYISGCDEWETTNSKDTLLLMGRLHYGLLLRNGSERIWQNGVCYTDYKVGLYE